MIEKEVRYGPRKLGQEAFERQQAAKPFEHRQATVYGARKGNVPKLVLEGDAEPQKADQGDGNPFLTAAGAPVPLGTLESLLEASPELLDVAVETEVGTGKPRVGAVELLTKLENARPDGARESVLNLLTKLG